MKKLIIYILLLFAGFEMISAQQVHQLTQYSLNDFAFNPAVAGKSFEKLTTRASYRRQWLGAFDGAEPTTMTISAHANFTESKAVGLGMMIYNDKTGPTTRFGVQLAYAYHIPLDLAKENYLSFGLSGTLLQYGLDGSMLDAADASDPIVATANESKLNGDANFGAYLYGPKYYVGISALQLVQSKFDLTGQNQNTDLITLSNSRHFYGAAGYKFDLSEDFAIEPSGLIKFVPQGGVPPSFEINLRAFYENNYWIGLGYRSSDALALMLGISLDNGLHIGYTYDIITSNIKNLGNGSHEILLGFDFEWKESSSPKKAKPFDYRKKKI